MKPNLHGLERIFLAETCSACSPFGSVTGAVHAALLKEDAIPSFKSIFPRGNGIFQQDNAPVHTAKVAKNALKDAEVKTLPWPAYSPDLNPIENLWSVMERNLRNRNPPGSITELRRMLQEEWNSLSQDMLRDLVESMPRRVRVVIDAKGGATCY